MKAAIYYRRGGPEVLQYEQVPDPKIKPDEVLIRVRACGINHLDIYTREGTHGVKAPLPHIGGLEPAGDVVQVGANVTHLAVGDRVLAGAYTWDGTCEYCLSGNENLCLNRKILGVQIDGGFADMVKAPASAVGRLPDNVSYLTAAAIPAAFGTAWHMLVTRAAIKPGEWVLVLAAGSGVGTAAIQVAKHFHCKVIATSSSDDKLEKAKALGADHVINYSRHPNFSTEVMRLTGGRGVDVAFEHVGPATWKQSLASLRPTGRLVTCGGSSGRIGETDIWSLFWKQVSILGSNGVTYHEFLDVLRVFEKGEFEAVIDRKFPMCEARAAQQYLIDRRAFGKVVLVND